MLPSFAPADRFFLDLSTQPWRSLSSWDALFDRSFNAKGKKKESSISFALLCSQQPRYVIVRDWEINSRKKGWPHCMEQTHSERAEKDSRIKSEDGKKMGKMCIRNDYLLNSVSNPLWRLKACLWTHKKKIIIIQNDDYMMASFLDSWFLSLFRRPFRIFVWIDTQNRVHNRTTYGRKNSGGKGVELLKNILTGIVYILWITGILNTFFLFPKYSTCRICWWNVLNE